MREDVGDLIHDVDAQIVVFHGDVHVHAGDHQAPDHVLEILLDDLIAFLRRALLQTPGGEGVGGGGDHGEPVVAGDTGHGLAQMRQVGSRLRDGLTDPGADLDLALEKLRRYLTFQGLLAGREHGRWRLVDEVAGVRVHEQVLLLDADGEAGLWHGER